MKGVRSKTRGLVGKLYSHLGGDEAWTTVVAVEMQQNRFAMW